MIFHPFLYNSALVFAPPFGLDLISMLGVIVGLVSAIGIITFLNRDPLAVQKHREEQQKLKQ